MKIAVLSDIHANRPAFDAVLRHLEAEAPDLVMVGGDVVNRGPEPRACLETVLDRIRHHGWKVCRGNHEDYVLHAARGLQHAHDWQRAVCHHTLWTLERIDDLLPDFAAWPEHTEAELPDGSRLVVLHASTRGNRVGLYEFMEEDDLLDHVPPHHGALCAGHTHIPFVRRVREKLIVNCGAVGMPFDGDPRASYAVFQWAPEGWSAEIVRVPYDRDATITAYHREGYLAGGGPMVPLILQELQQSRSRLGPWHRHYEPRVATGELSLEASVAAMLQDP
jgi:predicted phosphodiesterase